MHLVDDANESPVVAAVSDALERVVETGVDRTAVMVAAMGLVGVYASVNPEAVFVFLREFSDGFELGRNEAADSSGKEDRDGP